MNILSKKTKNYKKRRPQRPNPRDEQLFRFVDLSVETGWLRFYKLYANPKRNPALLHIRTDRLPKPIGGKTGAILVLDLDSGKLIEAEYAGWHEWIAYRDEFELLPTLPDRMLIEIKISEIQRVLNSQ